MLSDLKIQRVEESRLGAVDFDNLGFGDVYSDHMFSMHYDDGHWHSPEVLPYGPISLPPASATLHYGQSVFEGLRGSWGSTEWCGCSVPSATRSGCATPARGCAYPRWTTRCSNRAIDELVRLDHRWNPERARAGLLHPAGHRGDRAPSSSCVPPGATASLVVTAPVRAYFDTDAAGVALSVEERFTRASPGGTGDTKTAGNYGASLFPGQNANAAGYAQVLWLDGIEHRYVEEVGGDEHLLPLPGPGRHPRVAGHHPPRRHPGQRHHLLRDRGIEG